MAIIKQIKEATKRNLNNPILIMPYLPKKDFKYFVSET